MGFNKAARDWIWIVGEGLWTGCMSIRKATHNFGHEMCWLDQIKWMVEILASIRPVGRLIATTIYMALENLLLKWKDTKRRVAHARYPPETIITRTR